MHSCDGTARFQWCQTGPPSTNNKGMLTSANLWNGQVSYMHDNPQRLEAGMTKLRIRAIVAAAIKPGIPFSLA